MITHQGWTEICSHLAVFHLTTGRMLNGRTKKFQPLLDQWIETMQSWPWNISSRSLRKSRRQEKYDIKTDDVHNLLQSGIVYFKVPMTLLFKRSPLFSLRRSLETQEKHNDHFSLWSSCVRVKARQVILSGPSDYFILLLLVTRCYHAVNSNLYNFDTNVRIIAATGLGQTQGQ